MRDQPYDSLRECIEDMRDEIIVSLDPEASQSPDIPSNDVPEYPPDDME